MRLDKGFFSRSMVKTLDDLDVRFLLKLPAHPRGVSPTHAAKSRPFRKLSIGGANVCTAIAVSSPTPGIVIRRWSASSFLTIRRISRSISSISASSSWIRLMRQRMAGAASAGKNFSHSVNASSSFPTLWVPRGATRPNSPR